MIIRKITFQNILTYYGDQAVDLPIGGESSLTFIVGPNNSGKTSFIRGLKFWFYGESGLPKKSDLPLLISNKAKAETPVGRSVTAWVEVTFERTGSREVETYRLRRELVGKHVSEGRWEVRDAPLIEVKGAGKLLYLADEGGRLQRMIEGMVPRALFDAFYFKGEPLDGKLLGDVNSIRTALGHFLHEDQWKEAESVVASIRDDLGRKLAKLTASNGELNRKLKELEQNQGKLENQQAALEKEELALQEAEALQAEETENLAKLGDEEAAREVKMRFQRAQSRMDDAKNRAERAEQEILREVNQSLGIPFLAAAVEPVKEILAEMERDNILPADISEGFIDRVLARSACICGKKHDDDSRTSWEAYRKKTLAADANEGLRKLLDWVKPAGILSIQRRSVQIEKDLKRLTEQREKAVTEMNDAKDALAQARTAMEKVPIEEISRIGRALTKLNNDISVAKRRIETIAKEVHASDFGTRRLKDEVAALGAKSGVDQNVFQKLSAAKDRAERLLQALSHCRGRLGRYFHQALQSSVADFYDSKATDGSKAHIENATLLPAIQVQGQKTQNLGGGQSQLLALAYVVSLARLRQDMHAQMEKLGVRLGKIDDLSFLMDSPFGNMETHYKEAAVQLVPGSARQVVVLLWKEDWEFVREFYEDKADAIYAVRFHTTADDVKKLSKEARTYSFAEGEQELIQALPDGEEQPRSELVRIR